MTAAFDMICFSHQWDKYRRRYKSIMLELAKRDEVGVILFVEMPLTLTSLITFLLRRTGQYTAERWRRLFSRGMIFREGKVVVLTPICLVPFDRLERLQGLNVRLANLSRRWLLGRFLKRHELSNPVLWINHPHYTSGFVGTFGERLFIYDLCDDYLEFHDEASPFRRRLENEDRRLTEEADLMFVSSEGLYRKKEAVAKLAHRLPNAVDFDHFQEICSRASEPGDLIGIPRPRLCYLGKITHRTDLSMVLHAARKRPQWQFVLVGPVSPGTEGAHELAGLANVVFLGEKPYDEVPAYLKHVDVCIMPHKISRLSESMDPLKLYGYLASGKPIVSSRVAGIEPFMEVVRVADTADDFVSQIEAALADDRLGEKRLALARENSWEKRVATIFELIQEKLKPACEGVAA